MNELSKLEVSSRIDLATELVRAADTALYCAKNNGRNQYQAANQPVATAAP